MLQKPGSNKKAQVVEGVALNPNSLTKLPKPCAKAKVVEVADSSKGKKGSKSEGQMRVQALGFKF